jgi:hypothetical protein
VSVVCVLVVQVGIVRVVVNEPRMAMSVCVRLGWRLIRTVDVLVMLVMHVRVLVLERLMNVLVLVSLGEVEPDAQAHECASDKEPQRHRLAEHWDCEERPDKGRGREIGAGSRCPQVPQRQHKQSQAHPVAEEAHEQGPEKGTDAGNDAPCTRARTRFTGPATRPLSIAICTGSAAESLRVRLLSMPQDRHAPAMRRAPSSSPPCRPTRRG